MNDTDNFVKGRKQSRGGHQINWRFFFSFTLFVLACCWSRCCCYRWCQRSVVSMDLTPKCRLVVTFSKHFR
ncbi:hypothetical protein BgiBS90_026184, partial [Biomphalaria glabrata]